MNHQRLGLNLLSVLLLASVLVYGQGSAGPLPKKARTPDDYQPRTLKQLAALTSDARNRVHGDDAAIVEGDVLPSRVRLVYAGRARPLPTIKNDVLHRWAQRYAGAPEHYTAPYKTELLFTEQGVKHWLAVKPKTISEFRKQIKKGESADLYLIRLGGAGAGDKWEPLLLVESFQKPN